VRTRDGSYHLKQFIPRGKGQNSGYLKVVAGIYRATLGRACVPCFAPHPTVPDIVVGVRPWIEGEHCLGRLGAVRLRQLMRMLDELHTALREISDAAAMRALQSAIVGLSRDIGCLDEREREAFRATIEKVQSMFRDNARQVVVDMDVHRENIVFTKDKACKVDYESLSVGPAELQFASTLVGAFLLEDDTEAMAEAVAYLRRPQALNCGLVRDFMMLRALKGLAFFRCQPGKETASAARHIARYERCVDRLRYEVVPENWTGG
jgi:Ser/Thr protein kinase RdoA (MazF antagonist)